MSSKSTVDQIRARFDADVDRFSRLETGQSATMDAPLTLELVAQASARVVPQALSLLDIGCGAGNYSLKILDSLPGLDVTLVDLSRPMLDRAVERIHPRTKGRVAALQSDVRELELGESQFDIVVAAAVLHHLRDESEWHRVFQKIHHTLKPGGVFWISDLIEHSLPAVQVLMWERYGQYLATLKDKDYRDRVFEYIAQEDSPRSLLFQLDTLKQAGFTRLEVLHKNGCFASFGGMKAQIFRAKVPRSR